MSDQGPSQELLEKIDGVDRKLDQTRVQLEEKIDGVDRKLDQTRVQLEGVDSRLEEKIDGVDRKLDQTRVQLSTLITATATALEHRMDRKLEQWGERLEKAAGAIAEAAVERVLGTVYERATYDAAILDDRLRANERRLDEHISDEVVHLVPDPRRR